MDLSSSFLLLYSPLCPPTCLWLFKDSLRHIGRKHSLNLLSKFFHKENTSTFKVVCDFCRPTLLQQSVICFSSRSGSGNVQEAIGERKNEVTFVLCDPFLFTVFMYQPIIFSFISGLSFSYWWIKLFSLLFHIQGGLTSWVTTTNQIQTI